MAYDVVSREVGRHLSSTPDAVRVAWTACGGRGARESRAGMAGMSAGRVYQVVLRRVVAPRRSARTSLAEKKMLPLTSGMVLSKARWSLSSLGSAQSGDCVDVPTL